MDTGFYISLLLRRLPVMLALILICSVFAVVTAMRLPPTYSTSAQLLVESPLVSNDGIVPNEPAAEQLQVIEQQLMTRANLIDIANKVKVFGNQPGMSPDDIVSQMRNQTRIRRSSGRDEATLMSVDFTASNGRIAADVVNEYVTLILAANTRQRMGRAETALNFYQQEVDRLNTDLDQQSQRIVEFKRANSEALPENLRNRQDRQALLQERLSRLESDQSALEKQRDEMIRIFQTTGQISLGQAAATSPEQQQLAQLQAELRNVLGVYAEGSPKVRALRARIDALARTVEAQDPDVVSTPDGTVIDGEAISADGEVDQAAVERMRTESPILEATLSGIDSRLESGEVEINQTRTELEALEASVKATSANAIALAALERDYLNAQTRYNDAVANLNQARTAERIESTSRGQRITVLEGANVPNAPSGPNRKMIAIGGFALGLGLAGGFFLLMELLNRTIRRPAEIQRRFGVTPIAVIPYIESRRDRLVRRSWRLAAIFAVLTLLPIGLWYIHTQYMPLDILTQNMISRLGLE